jgi:TonB family protein
VKNERLSRVWPAKVLLFLSLPTLALPVVPRPQPALEQREHRLAQSLKRASEFENVPHVSQLGLCEQVQAPEALATPDPLLSPVVKDHKVKVSFIIGIDGRVHSPLILESAGLAGDRRVLETVRHWRYRPAMCNGVPTEIEGKIEFSMR